jgi:DNA-3-methyladenine glycosylase
MILMNDFFAKDPLLVAQGLLGKVLRHYYHGIWLSAMIIETEAYYLSDKGSHASLGFTEKRKALFMAPGTIYMYYARGGDSINVSCLGDGNAVLLKSGIPYTEDASETMLATMLRLNPMPGERPRRIAKLCSGQTLLCRSLGLKVPDWNQKTFTIDKIKMEDVGYLPKRIIQTRRLGIPLGRDEHLPYRFIDYEQAKFCTDNPLAKRSGQPGIDYLIHEKR